MKRIVLATFGSLGDVHPYIGIALAIKRRGHLPQIATSDLHRDAVESAGIAFVPMRPHAADLGDPAALVRRLFHPARGPEYLMRGVVMPHVRAAYEDLDRAAAGADLIVTHPLTFAGRLVAEKRGIAWRSTVLSPLSLMSAIDPSLFGPAPWLSWIRRLGVARYRAVFEFVKRRAGRWELPLHELRSDLGLPPMRTVSPERSGAESKGVRCYAQFEGQYAPEGNLALFSRALAQAQEDWPPNTTLCGFPRYDRKGVDPELERDFTAFVDAGPPPIVFTLGSSVSIYASDFFTTAIECARRLGRRGVLITGQDPQQYDAAIASAAMQGTIRVFRYLPYSLAFSHAAVNVHQGGIGTLAQALAAGKPQLITPVAFDQPDNARRTARLGLSRSIAFQSLTVGRMTAALRGLLADRACAANAAEVSRAVRAEDGAEHAAAALA